MQKLIFLFSFLIFLLPINLSAQPATGKVNSPEIPDFAPTLQFLASAGLEGRETGTRGNYIAADYIASMMRNVGLKPYHKVPDDSKTHLADYFQTFNLLRFSAGKVELVVNSSDTKSKAVQLIPGKDFVIDNAYKSLSLGSAIVFAGYGINCPEQGYYDYASHDVKGKLVLIMDGYPGQRDTLSRAWKKFKSIARDDKYDLDEKCREASRKGAAAIMVVSKRYLQLKSDAERHEKTVEPLYHNADYLLPGDTSYRSVPCFRLTEQGSHRLSAALKTDFRSLEEQYALNLSCKPTALNHPVKINLQSFTDTLRVHNVIGILPGRDTNQTVILGAHYDHLGKRGNVIYFGSDDNASGAAGLLALAKMWTATPTVPPCNILFASWTAEEKGLIGSEYFVSVLHSPEKVKLYINMDMISRSVTEDTAGRQLSIGIRTSDENLRELARKCNSTLSRPFQLDLWDVTGHTGSDYGSFTPRNIPVMTYNTGLHNDYHTPRDIPESADLVKERDVLKVVNESLRLILETVKVK